MNTQNQGGPQVSLAPAPDGSSVAMTLGGSPVATLSLDQDGSPVLILPPVSSSLTVTRDPGPLSRASGVIAEDLHSVTFGYPGCAPIVLPRVAPDETTPVGAPPVYGQDLALYLAAYCMATDQHIILMGDTGTGKTSIVRYLASLTGWSLIVSSITPGTEAADIVGEARIGEGAHGGPTVRWRDAQLAKAVRLTHSRPTILLLDEGTRIGNVGHYSGLFPVMDASRALETDDERIPLGSHPFSIMMTGNPADDDAGAYLGVTALDPALANRFAQKPVIGWPDPEVERDALLKHVPGLDPAVAARMIDTAGRVRKEANVRYPFGMRTLISWARLVSDTGMAPVQAAVSTVVQDATPDDRAAVNMQIALAFGVGEGAS